MAEHFLDLPGAETVKTAYFAHGLERLDRIVQKHAIGLFFGPPGAGKTYTAETAEQLYGSDRYCYMRVKPTPNPASLANEIALRLTGLEHKLDRHSAARVIVRILSADPRLLVLDEAQAASTLCINFIRIVHEDVRGRFPLLFVGGHQVTTRLSADPQLMRRIKGAEFRKLPRADVPTVMRGFHPMFAQADDDLLWRIDDECCHGMFGHWAHVADEALSLLDSEQLTTITHEIAAIAIREVNAMRKAAQRGRS